LVSQGVSPNFSCVRRNFVSLFQCVAILAIVSAGLILATGCATRSLAQNSNTTNNQSAAPQIQVTISPTSVTLAPGARQQFTATVRGTSNTATTWRASVGSISSDGTFTAPTVNSKTEITISANVAGLAQPATTLVIVEPATKLAITTSTLSAATLNTAYSGTLIASGGTPPYRWTVVAGALAPGFQLQPAGVLSGTTSTQGKYSFTAQVTDAASNSATQALTLAVSASSQSSSGIGSNCGAPSYCSTTSTKNPGPISALFTGKVGVNQTAYDTTYNPAPMDCYTRATDETTWGGASTDNNTFSGGDNDIMWSKNDSYVGVESGGDVYILHLNLSGNCAKVTNTGNLQGHNSIHMAGPFGFSKATDNVFYYLTNYTELYQGTITSDSTYTPALLANVADGSTCPGLPHPFNATHAGILGIRFDDGRFGWVLSDAGGQGTGAWAVVWDRDLGCAVANMSTGSYWAFCASDCKPSTQPSGILASNSACTSEADCNCWGGSIHDSQMSGDGNGLVITEYGVWTHGACAGKKYGTMYSIWQPGTGITQFCDSAPGTGVGGQFCGGHDSVGMTHMLNSQLTMSSIRSLSNVISYTQFDSGIIFEGAHGQWPHPDNDDTYPWVQASYDLYATQGTGCSRGANYCPINGGNAIFANYPARELGQPTTYFGHTFSCNTSSSNWAQCDGRGDYYFGCANGIMSVSQDGNWAMIASGMLLGLGTDSKNYPRCDTFIVHLN
jgi:hypothetical protein